MTARRSSIPHRLVHEDDESSSSIGGFLCGSSEEVVRMYLIAPSVVEQNEMFRKKAVSSNHFIHQRSCSSHGRRRSDTRNDMVRRTGNVEHCGLSAEIAQEIANRRPAKERVPIPRKKRFAMRKVGSLVPRILRRSQIEYVGKCDYKE